MAQAATHSKSQSKRAAAQKGLPTPPPEKQPEKPPPPPQQGPVHLQKAATYSIMVSVDWENLPIQLARDAYEVLSKEHEKAGRILNARTTTKPDPQFYCFMAGRPNCCAVGKVYTANPVFQDLSYKAPRGGHKDPRTNQITPEGLLVRVDICSVNCYHRYHELLVAERRERLNPAVNG